jgi:hypothetical protein
MTNKYATKPRIQKPRIQYQVLIEKSSRMGTPRNLRHPIGLASKYGGESIAANHTHEGRSQESINFTISGMLMTFAFDNVEQINEFRKDLASTYKIHEGRDIR